MVGTIKRRFVHFELVYLVTALVPSETACLANSPGNRSLTAVCISREVMVDLQQCIINTGQTHYRCVPFIVMGELAGFSGNSLEEVVDEGVHDAHGLGRHTSVGMNLLQNLPQVQVVRTCKFSKISPCRCRWRRTPSSYPSSSSYRPWAQPWQLCQTSPHPFQKSLGA